MAKSTKYAALICFVLSLLTAGAVWFGLVRMSALPIIIALLPVALYELWRTEGMFSKIASLGMVGILIAEAVLLITNKSFDLERLLGARSAYIGGYRIPFGDVRTVGTAIILILAGILFARTYGPYTRWLAAIIFLASLATIYILNPSLLGQVRSMV